MHVLTVIINPLFTSNRKDSKTGLGLKRCVDGNLISIIIYYSFIKKKV